MATIYFMDYSIQVNLSFEAVLKGYFQKEYPARFKRNIITKIYDIKKFF